MKKIIVKVLLSAVLFAFLGCVFSFGAGAATGIEDGVISFAVYEAGDANADGIVDIRDTVCMKKHIAGADNSIYAAAADIDGNSLIDGGDLVLLRKIILDS